MAAVTFREHWRSIRQTLRQEPIFDRAPEPTVVTPSEPSSKVLPSCEPTPHAGPASLSDPPPPAKSLALAECPPPHEPLSPSGTESLPPSATGLRLSEPLLLMPQRSYSSIYSLVFHCQIKVCLALTCKDLYDIFGWVLGASELRFPRLDLSTEELDDELYSDEKDEDEEDEKDEEDKGELNWYSRIHLLCLLEGSKWACCAHCQKPHPREEFIPGELSSTPSKRRCAKYARLLDRCPCITLTPRGRTRIVRYLRRTSGEQSFDLVDKGLLKDAYTEGEDYCLLHECGSYRTVRVEMRFYLREGSRLYVHIRYEIPSTALVPDVEPVYVCCDEYLKDSLDEMDGFDPPYSRYIAMSAMRISNC